MNKIYVLSFFILFIFGACTNPKTEDVIGIWKSEDNAEFHFYKDKTFKVSNIPESILFNFHSDKELYSGSGLWDLIYSQKRWKIELYFPKYSCPLFIEKGLNTKEDLLQLYFHAGAADTKYYFYRVNSVH